jgi:hypothetical protein
MRKYFDEWPEVNNAEIPIPHQTSDITGLSMHKGCIFARAPGGQMRGAATQAMRCHRREAATKPMGRINDSVSNLDLPRELY